MTRCYRDHEKSVAFYHIRPKALGVYVPVFNFRYPLSKSYDFFKLTSFTFYEEKVFNRLKTCKGQKYRHSSWHISSPACWSIGPRTVVIIFSQDTVPLNRQGWVINLSISGRCGCSYFRTLVFPKRLFWLRDVFLCLPRVSQMALHGLIIIVWGSSDLPACKTQHAIASN